MTRDELIAYEKWLRAFAVTEIGDLFLRYDVAIGTAWVSSRTSNSDGRIKRDCAAVTLFCARIAKTLWHEHWVPFDGIDFR